jgi:hypothetical protein
MMDGFPFIFLLPRKFSSSCKGQKSMEEEEETLISSWNDEENVQLEERDFNFTDMAFCRLNDYECWIWICWV